MPIFPRLDNDHIAADPLRPDRLRWQVREHPICSWHDLAESYSLDQMWHFLQQGRYSHALPLQQPSSPVTNRALLIS
jgi:hypothetical protein